MLQIHRQFRKPLVVIAPKNLLRHPQAKSPLAEFDEVADDKGIVGVRFKRVIMDAAETDRCAPAVPRCCLVLPLYILTVFAALQKGASGRPLSILSSPDPHRLPGPEPN